MRCLRRAALAAALLAGVAGAPAHAIEPIPGTPGWRGFVVLGAGYADLRSNLVAGNRVIDIGDPRFDSLDGRPRSDDAYFPFLSGELNYTFGNGWQAFAGTSLEDAVTMDGITQLGMRKSLGEAGTLQGGWLLSGIPSRTWEDPYAEGVARVETDRDSPGVRLQWDRVLGSPWELTFTYRDVSIDTERSGQGLVSVACDAACQRLLRRDGERYAFGASYLFRLGANRNHLLRPLVRYAIEDRDGDAVAGDEYWLQLSYIYIAQGYTVASNVVAGTTRRDAPNPVFGRKTDADRLAFDTTLFYRLPTQSGRWQAVASLFWGEEDSDVAFHDSELTMLNLGVMYRFGAR